MSAADPSHDWSQTGHCLACCTYVLALEARLKCKPSTAEPESTEQPPVIDWLKLNGDFAQ